MEVACGAAPYLVSRYDVVTGEAIALDRRIGDDVDVKGGVAVTMFDRENEVEPVGRFVADPTLKGIVDVVSGQMSASLADIVRPRSSYKLGMAVYEEHPSLRGVQSKGHDRDVGSNVFAKLADVFSDEPRGCDDVAVVGREDGRRVTKHLPSRYLVTPDNFDGFKVIVCKANGSGTVGEALSDPRVIGPKVGHADTFLSIGNFESDGEAEAALAYIKTKFIRVLLGSPKVTQDNSRAVWRNVPMQDCSSSSDIDWAGDVDDQLFRKYGLTDEQIAYIERVGVRMD